MSGGDNNSFVGRLPGLRTALIGCAIACLVGAVVFGLIAALAMDHPQCHGDCVLSDVPIALWSVIAVATVLLIAAIAALWGSRSVVAGAGIVSLIAIAVGFAQRSQVRAFRTPLFGDHPLSQQLPAAGAGYWLTGAGALLIALAAFFGPVGRPRKFVAVGVVVGVIAATALCVGVWRSATLDQQLDATTAAETEIPPVPARLGERKFRIPLGEPPHSGVESPFRVFTAGAAFVLWDLNRNALTAYDATGHERWHFRKTDNRGVIAVQVYDQGRTIIVAQRLEGWTITDPTLFTALDAMTGRQLWTGTGSRLNEAFHAGRTNVSPFLVARGTDRWTAFDSRTGEVTWEIPSPAPCGGYPTGDTAELLVDFGLCGKDELEFHLATVDPATGQVVVSRQLDELPKSSSPAHIDVRPAGAGGTAISYSLNSSESSSGSASRSAYVAAATGTLTEFSDATISGFYWPAGEFISRHGNEHGLFGPDARMRCTITEDGWSTIRGTRYGRAQAAWLGAELVQYVYGKPNVLRSIDRSDCRAGAIREISGIVTSMAAAPGVLALVLEESWDNFLEGYA